MCVKARYQPYGSVLWNRLLYFVKQGLSFGVHRVGRAVQPLSFRALPVSMSPALGVCCLFWLFTWCLSGKHFTDKGTPLVL